jgi:hypothetical protein
MWTQASQGELALIQKYERTNIKSLRERLYLKNHFLLTNSMTSQEINIKLDLLDPSSIHVDYVTRCGHKPLKENLPSSYERTNIKSLRERLYLKNHFLLTNSMTSQEINIKLDLLDPSSIHVDYVTRCGHKPLKENLPSSKNTKEQTSKVFERGYTHLLTNSMTSQEINIKLDLLDPSSIHVDYVTRCGHKPLKENLPSSKNTKEQTSKVFERGYT